MNTDRKVQMLGLFLIGIFIALFFVFPTIQLVISAFALSRIDLSSILSDPSLKNALWFTWTQSIASSLIACTLGLCIGIPLGLRPSKHLSTKIITSLFEGTFALPSLVIVSLFTMWLGRHGFLNGIFSYLGIESRFFESMYGPTFVIAAHVFYNAGFVACHISKMMNRIGFLECALIRSLGGSRMKMFSTVFIPYIRPVIGQAFSQVYLLSLSSFSIVLLLGGGPPTESLETLIYSEVRLGGLDFSKAAVLSLFQIALSMLILPLIRSPGSNLNSISGSIWSDCQKSFSFIRDSIVFSGLMFLVFPFLGFIGTVSNSLTHIEWSEFIREMSPFVFDSIRLSLVVATLSTIIVFFAVIFSLRRYMMTDRQMHSFDLIINVPSFVSSMCLAMGVFLIFSKWFNVWKYGFWFLSGFLTILSIPVGIRILRPTSLLIRFIQIELLRSLGCGFTGLLRYVFWPEMKANVFYLFVFVAASTFAEVSAASLLSSDSFSPLSVYVVRLFSEYRLDEANLIVSSYFVLNTIFFMWIKLRRDGERNVRSASDTNRERNTVSV